MGDDMTKRLELYFNACGVEIIAPGRGGLVGVFFGDDCVATMQMVMRRELPHAHVEIERVTVSEK
jgi:hypothetical protein